MSDMSDKSDYRCSSAIRNSGNQSLDAVSMLVDICYNVQALNAGVLVEQVC